MARKLIVRPYLSWPDSFGQSIVRVSTRTKESFITWVARTPAGHDNGGVDGA